MPPFKQVLQCSGLESSGLRSIPTACARQGGDTYLAFRETKTTTSENVYKSRGQSSRTANSLVHRCGSPFLGSAQAISRCPLVRSPASFINSIASCLNFLRLAIGISSPPLSPSQSAKRRACHCRRFLGRHRDERRQKLLFCGLYVIRILALGKEGPGHPLLLPKGHTT